MMVLVTLRNNSLFSDYGSLCLRILELTSNPNRPLLVSDGTRGGIGHKYLSILYNLIYAIINKRRFMRIQ